MGYKDKEGDSGSITVEMSMVFPIVLYVIFSIVYGGLYLHDRVVIQNITDEMSIQANNAVRYPVDDTGEQICYENINARGIFFSLQCDYSREQEVIRKKIMNRVAEKLYITQVGDIMVNLAQTNIQIEVACSVQIPIAPIRILLGEDKMTYVYKQRREVFNPAEYVRKYRVFLEVGEGTELGDKALKALRDILNGG
ncbi:TadE/TadG family type IV pilus assembly protein [Anaerosporobacter faecicola]|uniref:TadE/TadG family type IV pilus assembly protein n=1 Tax=Anaerosporobacter faecicola TaxID=2718714 RepID=UPI00143C7264|nr:TadE family protein [Anaerosporobacter faecicola]